MACDDDAVVAVHQHLHAVAVELDDVEVVPRHAFVLAVDNERLVARAAHRQREVAGIELDRAHTPAWTAVMRYVGPAGSGRDARIAVSGVRGVPAAALAAVAGAAADAADVAIGVIRVPDTVAAAANEPDDRSPSHG